MGCHQRERQRERRDFCSVHIHILRLMSVSENFTDFVRFSDQLREKLYHDEANQTLSEIKRDGCAGLCTRDNHPASVVTILINSKKLREDKSQVSS